MLINSQHGLASARHSHTVDSPKPNEAEAPTPARLQASQPAHPEATAETPGAVAGKDTEAPVGDGQVPEVDAQVVGRHVGLAVAVDGDGVDVVGVAIGKDPPRAHLYHQVHGLQHGHLGGEGQVGAGPSARRQAAWARQPQRGVHQWASIRTCQKLAVHVANVHRHRPGRKAHLLRLASRGWF